MSIHFGSWRGCCSGFILHCKLPSFFLYTLMLIIHAWFKRFVRAWRAPPLAEESAYVSFGHVPNLYSMASPVTFFLVPGPRPKTSVHTHTHTRIHTHMHTIFRALRALLNHISPSSALYRCEAVFFAFVYIIWSATPACTNHQGGKVNTEVCLCGGTDVCQGKKLICDDRISTTGSKCSAVGTF